MKMDAIFFGQRPYNSNRASMTQTLPRGNVKLSTFDEILCISDN